jgi:hypothetical protein
MTPRSSIITPLPVIGFKVPPLPVVQIMLTKALRVKSLTSEIVGRGSVGVMGLILSSNFSAGFEAIVFLGVVVLFVVIIGFVIVVVDILLFVTVVVELWGVLGVFVILCVFSTTTFVEVAFSLIFGVTNPLPSMVTRVTIPIAIDLINESRLSINK